MDFENYLKSNINDSNEISNAISFYDCFEKFTNLYDKLESINESSRAIGKYNSNICFIFKDIKHFESCEKALKRILPVYKINMWDILVLYVDKSDDESLNINTLLEELSIANPLVAYIFDDNLLSSKIISSSKNVVGFRIINVNNINDLLSKNVSTTIFDLFEYLITYNY